MPKNIKRTSKKEMEAWLQNVHLEVWLWREGDKQKYLSRAIWKSFQGSKKQDTWRQSSWGEKSGNTKIETYNKETKSLRRQREDSEQLENWPLPEIKIRRDEVSGCKWKSCYFTFENTRQLMGSISSFLFKIFLRSLNLHSDSVRKALLFPSYIV